MGYNILITGATGYLGSALSVDLCPDHHVVGLFARPPSAALIAAAPGVVWEKGDVAEPGCLDCIFRRSARQGRPIDYVLHFAAYTDYGEKWQDEYTNTNVIGTRNMVEAAVDAGVRRIMFAGSIAALDPGPPGSVLTENTSVYSDVAYSKSKAMGERLISRYADQVPVVILRLGGVFTDWCELPPLFSVMNLWSKPLVGRMMPGQGDSGFPYIHRRDVVALVRRILDKNECLERLEVLFAAHEGCTCQRELFPIIRRACSQRFSLTPVHVSPFPAKLVLHAKYAINTLLNRNTYERAWMIRYVDRPLVVDTSYTRARLDWEPEPGRHILCQLPLLVRHFRQDHRAWMMRNISRNDQKYDYHPD